MWLFLTCCPARHLTPSDTAFFKSFSPYDVLRVQVGIKRRYNNVLVDTDKQQQIEMFLGMKQDAFFPSLKLLYKVGCPCVNGPPCCAYVSQQAFHTSW